MARALTRIATPENEAMLLETARQGGWTMELDESGDARFYRPDGSPMPAVPEPPALPDEPAAALEGRHDALGIAIDPWTATPDWEGARLDIDWALFTLRQRAGAR